MHPELFSFGDFSIHSYGFLIMLGAIAGYFYMSSSVKKDLGIPSEKIQNLAILVILAAFVGGKLFFYFENPGYYFSSMSNMVKNFRTGFVFYGSLLFAIPVTVWYFSKQQWPVWPMLDRLAVTACIIHAFGRMGCFLAGCCYGKPTDSVIGVTFSDAMSQAKPLHTSLHPTQLYDAFQILLILVVLLMFKRYKRFEGQLFLIYLVLYAVGRGVVELFRGDIARGFIIDNILSHSQFISILLICGVVLVYLRLRKKQRLV